LNLHKILIRSKRAKLLHNVEYQPVGIGL